MKVYQNIEQNSEGINNSFLYMLYKNQLFDFQLYNDLIIEIKNLIKNNELDDNQTLNFVRKLFFIHSKLHECIVSHLNKNDLFFIKNWQDIILVLIQRLTFLIERVIDNDQNKLDNFIDELGELN